MARSGTSDKLRGEPLRNRVANEQDRFRRATERGAGVRDDHCTGSRRTARSASLPTRPTCAADEESRDSAVPHRRLHERVRHSRQSDRGDGQHQPRAGPSQGRSGPSHPRGPSIRSAASATDRCRTTAGRDKRPGPGKHTCCTTLVASATAAMIAAALARDDDCAPVARTSRSRPPPRRGLPSPRRGPRRPRNTSGRCARAIAARSRGDVMQHGEHRPGERLEDPAVRTEIGTIGSADQRSAEPPGREREPVVASRPTARSRGAAAAEGRRPRGRAEAARRGRTAPRPPSDHMCSSGLATPSLAKYVLVEMKCQFAK